MTGLHGAERARRKDAEVRIDALAEYENLDGLLATPDRLALARAVGVAARRETLALVAAKEQAEADNARLREALANAKLDGPCRSPQVETGS